MARAVRRELRQMLGPHLESLATDSPDRTRRRVYVAEDDQVGVPVPPMQKVPSSNGGDSFMGVCHKLVAMGVRQCHSSARPGLPGRREGGRSPAARQSPDDLVVWSCWYWHDSADPTNEPRSLLDVAFCSFEQGTPYTRDRSRTEWSRTCEPEGSAWKVLATRYP